MSLFNNLFGDDKKKGQEAYGLFSYMDENQKETDEDEVYNNLEDWQKEEVKKGNEDSWNFEEEDLEDDDYYSDDDE